MKRDSTRNRNAFDLVGTEQGIEQETIPHSSFRRHGRRNYRPEQPMCMHNRCKAVSVGDPVTSSCESSAKKKPK
jgi:hypothetical protein